MSINTIQYVKRIKIAVWNCKPFIVARVFYHAINHGITLFSTINTARRWNCDVAGDDLETAKLLFMLQKKTQWTESNTLSIKHNLNLLEKKHLGIIRNKDLLNRFARLHTAADKIRQSISEYDALPDKQPHSTESHPQHLSTPTEIQSSLKDLEVQIAQLKRNIQPNTAAAKRNRSESHQIDAEILLKKISQALEAPSGQSYDIIRNGIVRR